MPILKPIENCYWVLGGQFLAGEYPRNKDQGSSIQKLNNLENVGVSVFIDLTEKHEGLEPYAHLLPRCRHLRFPIRDAGVPESESFTRSILDTIDSVIDHKEIPYVHCWGGIGRTGLIVGCWLARHGYKGNGALARLHHLWQQCPKSTYRNSPETEQQAQYIINWKEFA